MSLYENLQKVNIADAVKNLGLAMDYDGKVRIKHKLMIDSPWIEKPPCADRNCLLWKDIFFDHFRVIHPGCMSCWKTYCFPETVKELFEIYELQKDNEAHGIMSSCKCGVETRPYTGQLGGYAAFWYNPLGCGLEKARENTQRLSEIYKRPLLLKRGCTEMEQYTIRTYRKDSSEWEKFLEPSKAKLEILELTFEVDKKELFKPKPLSVVFQTLGHWIRYAFEHGDMTYLEFTDHPLKPVLRQYMDSIDKGKEIDDGYLWNDYRKHGINKERVGGVDGKQEQALLTSLEGL